MIVAVTGGRDFRDAQTVHIVLTVVYRKVSIDLLIEGGGPGADTLCRQWATARGIPVETIPADWTEHGWAAGPVRNRAILDRKPGLLVVFTGSPEAEDFARLAAERHLLVFRWPRNPPPPAPSTDGTTVTG